MLLIWVFIFETGPPYVALDCLDLATQTRMAGNWFVLVSDKLSVVLTIGDKVSALSRTVSPWELT